MKMPQSIRIFGNDTMPSNMVWMRRSIVLLALILLSFLCPSAASIATAQSVQTLFENWAQNGTANTEVIDAVLKNIKINSKEAEDLLVSQIKTAGEKYTGGSTSFLGEVLDQLDKRRFQKVQSALQQVLLVHDKGLEAVIRTGSSGLRHIQLNGGPNPIGQYRALFSDDDISFVGTKAIEAADMFNNILADQGLDRLKVKGFDLLHLKNVRQIDLTALDLMDPEKFLGEAGLGSIKGEMLEKGAVIAQKTGTTVELTSTKLSAFVEAKKSQMLADLLDEGAIKEAVKKYGSMTMVASCERQAFETHSWETLADPEKAKYILRQRLALQESGALRSIAGLDPETITAQITRLRELKSKPNMGAEDLDWLLTIRKENVILAFKEIPQKMEPIIALAELEGRSIASNPEIRKAISELTTGFALFKTGKVPVPEEQILAALKQIAGGDHTPLYDLLYTSYQQSKDLLEVVEQWTKSGGSRQAFLDMLVASESKLARLQAIRARNARKTTAVAEKETLTALEEMVGTDLGDTFIMKMLKNPNAKRVVFGTMAVVGGGYLLKTMYSSWSKGTFQDDLSDAAFALIDFAPGGMSIKRAFTAGVDGQTALLFVKDALYFSPLWPLALSGDMIVLAVDLGSSMQTQNYHDGIIDILVYSGEFEKDDKGARFLRLSLPDGAVVERDGLRSFLFETKAVKVNHAVKGKAYWINDLSAATYNVYNKYYLANDGPMEQLRQAAAQQMGEINKHEAWSAFERTGSPFDLADGYLNYLAGFEWVCKNSPERWCKVFDRLKETMEKRKEKVIPTVMIPQIIQLAEAKRSTLDGANDLEPKLADLQKALETVRGEALGIDLVAEVKRRAKEKAEESSGATAEEKALKSGQYWQDAFKAYRAIYAGSKDIGRNIAQKTGYERCQVFQFPWTGDYGTDVILADQSKAGFAAALAKISRDINGVKKGIADPGDDVDRQAFSILGDVVFPWRMALDQSRAGEPSEGSAYFQEYGNALEAVKRLYGQSGELQALLNKGASLVKDKEQFVIGEQGYFELRLTDEALKKELAAGNLRFAWSSQPAGSFRLQENGTRTSFVATQPGNHVVTVKVERLLPKPAEGFVRATIPVKAPDNFVGLMLTPSRPKPSELMGAEASIPETFYGRDNIFHYRWTCDNCTVDNFDRLNTAVTAPREGNGAVRIELLVHEANGDWTVVASRIVRFAVEKKPDVDKDRLTKDAPTKTDDPVKGKDDKKTWVDDTGNLDGKATDKPPQDIKKEPPVCSFEYSDWGECVRATKKQTRSVKGTKPEGCMETQKPVLEQACTPPPSEEDKKNAYLNCLCRCSSGWAGHIGVWYDPEGKSEPECKSTGPCFGGAGAFGCTRRHFFIGPDDCGKGCWEAQYGKGTYDSAKADKLRKDENKKYKKPLTVKINPSKNPADFGDIVTLQAEAAEGSGGYSYNWGGCAQDAKDAFAKVVNTRECKACTATLTVTDLDSESASTSVTLQCNTVKVKLTKESPKENTVPVGGKATFYAEVFSGDKPFSGPTLYYHWEPNPEVVFGDPKNPSFETAAGSQTRNTATFRKVGTTSIWVTVLRDMDGRKATIGESQQIPVTVVNPEVTIKATSEKPNIGQEVKLEASTTPVMGDDIIGFWWEIPGYWTGTGNTASIRPKDDKPIKVTVHAKTKDGGDEVGTKEVTITAQAYQVSITEPRYLESPPQIWKCDTQLGQAQNCGMVTVKPTEFAVFRDLFMKATITPQPDSPRYRWTVDPAGSCGLPGAGSEVKLNCSSTGTYMVKVEVTNGDGAKLGEAAQSVAISISSDVLDGSKKAKDAAERLQKAKNLVAQGSLDEGISLAGEAASLDPKNAEAKTLGDRWKGERQTIQKNLEDFKKFIDEGKLREAQKEYENAAKLNGKYKPVIDAGEVLKKKQEEAKQKKTEATKKLETAQALAKQGKIDEAIAVAQDVAKTEQTLAAPILADLGAAAKKTGWDALNKGDYQTAVKYLEQAVKLNPGDSDATKKLADAKVYAAQMPRAEAKVKEFDGFISQKKVWSAHKTMLELQDILRPLAAGQSSENPMWKHVNDELNRGLAWYNDFSQKAMSEWTRLFKEQEWEQAETHLKQVLAVELSPADRKQHESSLQLVNTMLGNRKSAMQYYESAKVNFSKGVPADASGLAAVAKELRNREGHFVQKDPRRAQLEDLALAMEKKQRATNAKAYAQSSFGNGDQYYRAYNFEAAIGQYAEGLKAMKENGDISDPDYGKYYKLWEDAIARDKRFKELYSYAASLAMTDKALDEETIRKGIGAAEEALKIRPKNGDMEIHWNKLKWKLGELQRVKSQQQQAALACEAKWGEGKAFYDSGRFSDALSRFRENLACAPGNREREAYIRQLEDSLQKKEAAKQACIALRQMGDSLAQQKKYPEAIAKYRESLRCQPDPKLEEYIGQIEATMKQGQEAETRKAQAKRLRDDAYTLQQQNRLREAIGKYKESLAMWPDQQLADYVKQLEVQASKPVGLPVSTTTPVQTAATPPSSSVSSFSGTWNATGKQKENLTFVISQTGGKVTGAYSIEIPIQGGKETFGGKFEGTVSGNRATGAWRDAKEKEGVGTFELVMASDGKSFSAILSGGDVTERYTAVRAGGGSVPQSSQSPVQTSSQARSSSVNADITNKSGSSTHIFIQGESFGPANKFAPGERRRVQVQMAGNGAVTFVAGRDGKVITTKTWQGDPTNPGRTPTVVFDETNPFDKLVVSTALK
jgi:tetratricopeptide (TPR) repeat protein